MLGTAHMEALLPGILEGCKHRAAHQREGHLTLFQFLPITLETLFQVRRMAAWSCCLICLSVTLFVRQPLDWQPIIHIHFHIHIPLLYLTPYHRHPIQPYLGRVLPAILDGLADESEGVREAALSAGERGGVIQEWNVRGEVNGDGAPEGRDAR